MNASSDEMTSLRPFFRRSTRPLGPASYIDIKAFYTKLRESRDFENGDNDFFGCTASTEAIPYTVLDVYYMGQLDNFEQEVDQGEGTVTRSIERAIHDRRPTEFMYKASS